MSDDRGEADPMREPAVSGEAVCHRDYKVIISAGTGTMPTSRAGARDA
jgi:hypothetical protein